MKTVLRNGIMFLLSAVFCMCFSGPALAEGLTLTDAETYDAHGVYVNEENFPDDNFRQYVLEKYGSYLSSGEIASAKVINCTNNNYWYDDPNDGNPEEPSINVPEGYASYIGEDGITYYVDTVGNTYVLDTDGNLVLCVPKNPENDQDHSTDDEVYTPPYDPSEGEPFIVGSYGFAASDSETFDSDDGSGRIKSLKGIEYFTELEELYCVRNALSEIDLSKNTALKCLDCSYNKLLNLDVTGNKALTTLDCSHNKLTGLDLSSNKLLETLLCYNNQLKALDLSDNLLINSIYCENNAITNLNLSNKINLHTLFSAKNQINYLSIEQCPLLMKLTAENEPGIYYGELRYMSGAELVVDETVKLIPVNCHAINETDFPDANFRAYIAETFDTDGDLYLCKDEIEAAIEIDCAGLGIYSLKGLEFFCNLKKLNCSDNNIEYFTICESADLLALIDRVQPEVTENHVSYTDADTYLIYDTDTILMDTVQPKGIINRTNFPDTVFRDYVSNKIDLDSNGFLSEEEITAVTWIDCSGNGEEIGSIQSMKGLEIFQNLELLDCSYNRLRDLDVSNNPKLKALDCSTNRLVGYLDVTSNPTLETLWCYSNRLEDVDLGHNENLIELWCNDNQLMALDISGLPGLKVLWCDANKLTELDTTGNPALETLCCANNKLEKLNLSQNLALRTLWCFNNRIEKLYLFNNPDLKKLGCYGNFMSELDISPCAALCELVANHSCSERDGAVYYFDESSSDPVYLQYDIGTTLITNPTPDLILPSSLTVVGDEAFTGGAFTYVKLPEGVTTIGWHAFADCPKLAYIYIPASVKSIDENAFDGVASLTIFGIPGSEASEYAGLHGFTFAAQQ